MAKHFSAVLQKIATNIRSLASDNKQKPSYKNVKKYLGSILSENKTPAKQKQVNLTLKCLSSLFTLKKNSFVTVTNQQTNNQLHCQILAEQSGSVFHSNLDFLSFPLSKNIEAGNKRLMGAEEKYKQIETKSAQCRNQARLSLMLSCDTAGFPCTPAILTYSSASVQTVPKCISGDKCSLSEFSLHNKSTVTFVPIFTQTRFSFDPGGITNMKQETDWKLDKSTSETCSSEACSKPNQSVVWHPKDLVESQKETCSSAACSDPNPPVVWGPKYPDKIGSTVAKRSSKNPASQVTSGKLPKMKISPKLRQSTIFFQNEMISLKVKIFNTVKVIWRKNENEIKKGRVSILRRPCLTMLKIEKAKSTDSGIYTLEIENNIGKNSISFLVQVNAREQLFGKS